MDRGGGGRKHAIAQHCTTDIAINKLNWPRGEFSKIPQTDRNKQKLKETDRNGQKHAELKKKKRTKLKNNGQKRTYTDSKGHKQT